MSILKTLGLTKDAISRLLGVHKTVETQPVLTSRPTKPKKRQRGRPAGRHIDQSIVDAVRNSHQTSTIRELAKKHNVSAYWVMMVRKGKLRKD